MTEIIPFPAQRCHRQPEARYQDDTSQPASPWRDNVMSAIRSASIACAPDAGLMEVLQAHIDRLRTISRTSDQWAQQIQINIALAELQDRCDKFLNQID